MRIVQISKERICRFIFVVLSPAAPSWSFPCNGYTVIALDIIESLIDFLKRWNALNTNTNSILSLFHTRIVRNYFIGISKGITWWRVALCYSVLLPGTRDLQAGSSWTKRRNICEYFKISKKNKQTMSPYRLLLVSVIWANWPTEATGNQRKPSCGQDHVIDVLSFLLNLNMYTRGKMQSE